jgi:hypothetical protein
MNAFVDTLLTVMVPAALADDTDADRSVAWSEDGEDWYLARRLVADALTTRRAPEIPPRLRRRPPARTRLVWWIVGAVSSACIVTGIAIAIRARKRKRQRR